MGEQIKNNNTLKSLSITDKDFIAAAKILKCDIAAIKAVCHVEAPNGGFGAYGDPIILFEGHWFHRFTSGIYDIDYPDISYKKWTKKFYGRSQIIEYKRYNTAFSLSADSAIMSTSWGKFQIMGFNFAVCGFPTVNHFIDAMWRHEKDHLNAFCNYIKGVGLDDELRLLRWDKFAYKYNGPEYRKNKYAEKLASAYSKFTDYQW